MKKVLLLLFIACSTLVSCQKEDSRNSKNSLNGSSWSYDLNILEFKGGYASTYDYRDHKLIDTQAYTTTNNGVKLNGDLRFRSSSFVGDCYIELAGVLSEDGSRLSFSAYSLNSKNKMDRGTVTFLRMAK